MATLNVDNGATSAIKYEVVKNFAQSKLKAKDVYNARVVAPSKSLREVADTMVREGSKYETAEVVAILEKFADVCTRLLQEGNAINVGSLVHFRPSIRGSFASLDENYTPEKHQIVVSATIGSALRNVASGATVTRVDGLALPVMSKVFNGITGTENTLSSEGDIIVQGKRLTWNVDAEDEGFYTIIEGSKVKCEVYKTDEAGTTAFMHTKQFIMEGDEAQLIFCTRATSNGELVTFAYDKLLAYEAAPDAGE